MEYRLQSGKVIDLNVKPSDLMAAGYVLPTFIEDKSVFLTDYGSTFNDYEGEPVEIPNNMVCGCAIGAVMYASGLKPTDVRSMADPGAIGWFNEFVGCDETPYQEFGLEDQVGFLDGDYSLGQWASAHHSEGMTITDMLDEFRRVGL